MYSESASITSSLVAEFCRKAPKPMSNASFSSSRRNQRLTIPDSARRECQRLVFNTFLPVSKLKSEEYNSKEF